MKNLLILLSLLSLPALAQGPVRSVDTISDLVNTVNPAASAQGDSVIYAVKGYHTPGDFGTDRFFTASTTAATTNLAHVFRSAKNSSFYWQSLDLNSPNQDPRWFGAYANSTNNSVTNIQAALDYSDPHARRLWLPGGTYFTIDKPIKFDTGMSGGNDYMSVELIGNGAKLVQTSETNIIQLEAQSIFYGKLEDVVFTYKNVVSNVNANVISLRGDPTGPNYYNVYNVSFNNLTFLRGYYAIKQEEWCSPWGNQYVQWFVSQEMTGGAVDFAPASNFGNVNNVFSSIYARADVMAGPVFKIKNQNLLSMRDIEINILHDKQALLLTASSSVDIRNWRMEVGSFNTAYDGIFQLANVTQLTWDNLQIQSFDLDAPNGTWNYIIRDVGAGPAPNISSLQFNNLYLKNITKTNAASYLAFIYSPYQRYTLQTWDSDLSLVNAYAAYPFGAPATNVTAQPWHRNITDLPTLPGEIAFDDYSWPYISTGIGSVTNWLRIGNSDVFGPASSADNAVVRFDGTTGKRIKNSGVLIDNSDNMTVPGTILDLGSGAGNPIVSIKGAAGGVRAVRFYSGSTSAGLRWNVGASSTAESGSNAGSDYEWNAYNDAGVFLITPFSIERATAKINTYGKIAYGALVTANPPSIAHYTGSPEGLDTDNPGSLRLDKNGNVWLKVSGTGNTGWRQLGMTTVANGSTIITNIAQGTGIQITTAGETATIGMSNTAVAPGTYNYSTITVDQQGRITSASSGSVTPYTSFWPDLTNTVKAGANISISNDTATSKMYISAIAPTASTNGTPVSVNASPILTYANFQSTVGILVNASGTNITLTIADRDFGDITVTDSGETFIIDNGVIDTNKITAGFHAWVESQSGSAYTFSTGLTNSGGTVTTSLAAGTGIVFTTNAQTITISAPYTNIVVAVNGGAAMSVVNFQDNSQITFSQTGSNITASLNTSNDGIANLLLVTDTETTDTNQDTTWRDVTPSARSGMSATIPAGELTAGTMLKIEVMGELVTVFEPSNWSPDFKIVFDGPTGTDYEIVFNTTDPGTSGGWDGTTWTIDARVIVRTAGNPATLIQRSHWLNSDAVGNYENNLSGWAVTIPGVAANSLNTSADNTVKLYYRANTSEIATMKVSSLVVWKL